MLTSITRDTVLVIATAALAITSSSPVDAASPCKAPFRAVLGSGMYRLDGNEIALLGFPDPLKGSFDGHGLAIVTEMVSPRKYEQRFKAQIAAAAAKDHETVSFWLGERRINDDWHVHFHLVGDPKSWWLPATTFYTVGPPQLPISPLLENCPQS